ncbi:hypothetical protein [Streptococcus dentiloxodontae]
MKRLLSLLAFALASIFLVACSNQNSLDGEYYEIDEYSNDKIVVIKGDEGTVDAEGATRNMTINTDLKTFEVSDFVNPTVTYKYKDGVLTANFTGSDETYYKKGTEAYEKALKKYGYDD